MSHTLSQIINILDTNKFDFSNLPERLKCILCHKILQNPKQTLCGCKVCDKCITIYLSEGPKACPNNQLDCMNVKLNVKEDIYPDYATNKEILNFIIDCPLDPCLYRCALRNIVEHIDSCQFQRIICGKCGIKILVKEKVNHDQNKCELRIVKCDYCSSTMNYRHLINIHLNADADELCSKFVGICPNNCNETHKINIKEHLKFCTNNKLECIFHEMTKKELIKHMKEEYSNQRSSLMNKIETVVTENHDLISQLSNQTRIIKELFQICKKLSVWSLIRDETKNELIKKGIFPTIQTVDNENKLFRFFSFQWKIKDFKECRICAESGENVLITSDPFYTSELGYKMYLFVYPAGTGDGEGTHLSVFFTIMRGEFDDLLPWPFKKVVVLSILDQESGGKLHSDTFQPDVESECYRKPNKEYNISSGSSRFISLSLITNNPMYCKNDTILIQITVHDWENLKPQNILS